MEECIIPEVSESINVYYLFGNRKVSENLDERDHADDLDIDRGVD
jgi:hypothetical protein